MPKVKGNVLGAWAFLIGVILAVVIGLLGLTSEIWVTILLVLGIIIGLLNIGGAELKEFMLAGTVLVIVSALGGQSLLSLTVSVVNIGAILQALVTLFVPATIVVALKAVFAIAKR
jgi:hypothetical protein